MARSVGIGISKALVVAAAIFLLFRMAIVALIMMYAGPGGIDMVATIPNGMEITVVAWIALISVVICVGCYIWRYAEHNARSGLNRKTNSIWNPKFLGALILALALTIYLAYVLAPILVDYTHVSEPAMADFVLFGGLVAILAGLGFTILFSEGVSGFTKFLSQKVKEVTAGAVDILQELQDLREAMKRFDELEGRKGDDEDPNGKGSQ